MIEQWIQQFKDEKREGLIFPSIGVGYLVLTSEYKPFRLYLYVADPHGLFTVVSILTTNGITLNNNVDLRARFGNENPGHWPRLVEEYLHDELFDTGHWIDIEWR